MSSLAVRDALRAAWATVTPNLPYVETINVTPDENSLGVPIWGTFVFEPQTRDDQTMGSRPWIEESGTALVVLMSYAGIGDDDVVAVAEDVVRGWTMWINSTRDIWIHSVDPPRPPDAEAVGDTFRMAVALTYRYQTRGGL